LKWKFKEGDKFYVEDVQTTKTDVSVLGMQIKEDTKTTTVTSYTIKKVNSDNVVLVQKIENVETKSQGGLGGASEKIMEKMKGATFTITMTPDGKVTKFEGYKDFAKKLTGDDDEMGKMLNLFFSEDLFRSSAESAFNILPKTPVKEGDTWKDESKIPVPGLGDFKTVTNYTYKGKVEGGHRVDLKQNLTYTVPKDSNLIGGVFKFVKGDLKAENAKGHYIFDAEKGRLVSAKIAMFIKGRLTVDVAGQNVELHMTIDQEATSRVLDQNPAKD
jgi:hypothetical protein